MAGDHKEWLALWALIILRLIIVNEMGDQNNSRPPQSLRPGCKAASCCSFTAQHLPSPSAIQLCLMTEPNF